jgi:hypothetical protein
LLDGMKYLAGLMPCFEKLSPECVESVGVGVGTQENAVGVSVDPGELWPFQIASNPQVRNEESGGPNGVLCWEKIPRHGQTQARARKPGKCAALKAPPNEKRDGYNQKHQTGGFPGRFFADGMSGPGEGFCHHRTAISALKIPGF